MTIADQITEELKKENLTVSELDSRLTGIDKTLIYTNITRMKNKELIITVGTKNKENIYALNPEKFKEDGAKVKQLRELLQKIMDLMQLGKQELLTNEDVIKFLTENQENFNQITEEIGKLYE